MRFVPGPPAGPRAALERSQENDRAELSVLATSLDDLAARITAAADRYRGHAPERPGRRPVRSGAVAAQRVRKLEQVLRTMR